MSQRGRSAIVLIVTLAAVAACTHSPDVTLNPAPPVIEYAPLQHPFVGAELAVDRSTQAVRWQREHDADWLTAITAEPQARWINNFQDLADVPSYLAAARSQRAIPVIVAYSIPNRGCSGFREGAPYSDYDREVPRPDSYHAWINALVRQLGSVRTIIVLEPDAVAADCFDDQRAADLRGAVEALVGAGHHVYLDAGHPNWVKSGPMAERLLRSGVAGAEGVSLNVANRYPTAAVAAFGEELSDLIGGRNYIVDTSRNGFEGGSADPATVADDWCNRPDQALGVQQVGSPAPERWPHLAATLWIKPPGESDGNQAIFPNQDCHGETAPPGAFSARQARQLIINDPRQPASVRARVRAIQPPEHQ